MTPSSSALPPITYTVAQDKVISFEFELAETIKSLDDAEARTRNLLSLRKEW
jgi:hypothetical protein